MVGPETRQGNSFLANARRSWEWMFVRNGFPGSELGICNTTKREWTCWSLYLRRSMENSVVVGRDWVLVMDENVQDLWRYAPAVSSFCAADATMAASRFVVELHQC